MNILVDKNEVLRYLGYENQDISAEMNELIDEVRNEILKVVKFKYTYKIVDLEKSDDGRVNFKDKAFPLLGEDINKHLIKSEKCCVLAATLGVDMERLLNRYGKLDLTRSVILDSCGTQMIEEVCDGVEEIIKKDFPNYNFTFRFSPGYGDYPIEIQEKLVGYLDGYRKIGLSVTSNSILIPRKSVTALIGFQKEKIDTLKAERCGSCPVLKSCKFRRDGIRCYSIKK